MPERCVCVSVSAFVYVTVIKSHNESTHMDFIQEFDG